MSKQGFRLSHVRIGLRGRLLVAVDASVLPGEVLTVMGPSGSGKSTLLAYVAGFLDPAFSAEGQVILDGRDITRVPPERRGVGLLFQDSLLLPHLSVAGNLLLGIPASVRGRAARRRIAEEALAGIGLDGYSGADPATLSGGQKARVALLRTLLAEPRALALDEPFSSLDAALRAQMRDLVFGEARRRGLPVLLVTHDADDAAAAGGPVIDLAEHGGATL
ncbi:ATP-binding cassette domain-containing protein [Faunimonas sp. B44]|uniref:ATP-binding cassette domain-containing protein n=1 Tax=Faunimonas sp. B44 TaxID=3461493 RepID=UPI004043DAB0